MYNAILMLAMTSGAESIDHYAGRALHGGSRLDTGGGGCCSSAATAPVLKRPVQFCHARLQRMVERTAHPMSLCRQTPTFASRFIWIRISNKALSADGKPNPDAELWFDGMTTQRAAWTACQVSPLENGKYTYTTGRCWMETVSRRSRTSC